MMDDLDFVGRALLRRELYLEAAEHPGVSEDVKDDLEREQRHWAKVAYEIGWSPEGRAEIEATLAAVRRSLATGDL